MRIYVRLVAHEFRSPTSMWVHWSENDSDCFSCSVHSTEFRQKIFENVDTEQFKRKDGRLSVIKFREFLAENDYFRTV